ncbi:MAG: hypothetical protein AAF125_22100 [Chloroflexota bacterium]
MTKRFSVLMVLLAMLAVFAAPIGVFADEADPDACFVVWDVYELQMVDDGVFNYVQIGQNVEWVDYLDNHHDHMAFSLRVNGSVMVAPQGNIGSAFSTGSLEAIDTINFYMPERADFATSVFWDPFTGDFYGLLSNVVHVDTGYSYQTDQFYLKGSNGNGILADPVDVWCSDIIPGRGRW